MKIESHRLWYKHERKIADCTSSSYILRRKQMLDCQLLYAVSSEHNSTLKNSPVDPYEAVCSSLAATDWRGSECLQVASACKTSPGLSSATGTTQWWRFLWHWRLFGSSCGHYQPLRQRHPSWFVWTAAGRGTTTACAGERRRFSSGQKCPELPLTFPCCDQKSRNGSICILQLLCH